MRCTIPSVNCTLRTARALNDPYGSNELNFPLADRYSAGVLDMTEGNALIACELSRFTCTSSLTMNEKFQ